MFLGVKAVIAKSFERIHAANLINFGILPLMFSRDADYEGIDAGNELEIAGIAEALKQGTELMLEDKTAKKRIPLNYSLSGRQREILLAGGMLNYTRSMTK